ncbi:SLC13 family permease [Streptomyces sp. NPDC058373]|uniref:SLC13 family permease n=1 Tax=Streptomyces sp. NPDC058373 TaxID=3346465 RepID=UPI00365D700C
MLRRDARCPGSDPRSPWRRPGGPRRARPRRRPRRHARGGTGTAAAAPSRLALWSSAAALATLVGGGVVFSLHLGLLGLALAFALQLLLRLEPSALVHRLPWEIVLLIAGLLTYVGLMEHLGAFERITAALSVTGSPVLSLLAICFLAGLISFFASSIAVIATAVPLVAPLVAAGVSPVGAITAVALSAVLVDVNPLGITGGLLLGSAAPEHRDRLFRQLLGYGVCAIVLGPALAWAAFGWTL